MAKSDLNRFPERPGMKEAVAATKAAKRKPDEFDARLRSTFPMTPAAREALREPQSERLC